MHRYRGAKSSSVSGFSGCSANADKSTSSADFGGTADLCISAVVLAGVVSGSVAGICGCVDDKVEATGLSLCPRFCDGAIRFRIRCFWRSGTASPLSVLHIGLDDKEVQNSRVLSSLGSGPRSCDPRLAPSLAIAPPSPCSPSGTDPAPLLLPSRRVAARPESDRQSRAHSAARERWT